MKRFSDSPKRYPATCHFHRNSLSFHFVNKPPKLPEKRNGQAQIIRRNKSASNRPDNDARGRLRERSDNIIPPVSRPWLFPAWSARRIRYVRMLAQRPRHRPILMVSPSSCRDLEEQYPHSCRQPYRSRGTSRETPQNTPGKSRLRQGFQDRLSIMARFSCSPGTSLGKPACYLENFDALQLPF